MEKVEPVIPDTPTLSPGGNCFIFRSSNGLWSLLPGAWGSRILIYEMFISEENVINVISPVLLNKFLTTVLNSILTWVNKINKIHVLETPTSSLGTDPENTCYL